MSFFEAQFSEIQIGPDAGTAVTAGNGVAGAAVDLSAYRGAFVMFRFPGKVHVRFGPSSSVAAATTDFYLLADEARAFKVIEGREFVSAWGVGAAHAGVAVQASR